MNIIFFMHQCLNVNICNCFVLSDFHEIFTKALDWECYSLFWEIFAHFWIRVHDNLGILRYVSRYAFDIPVHWANSVNFRSIVHLLSFRAVFYLLVNFYLTSLDN